MNLPLPKNLPLLLNDPRQFAVESVARILGSETMTTEDIIIELSRHWKLKMTFSIPVNIATVRHWVNSGENTRTYTTSKTDTTHIIPCLFRNNIGVIGYAVRRGAHKGYRFDSIHNLVSYEPVIVTKRDDIFATYEDFKNRFDLKFITEAKIRSLWATSSSHTGEQYTRRDFRPFSKTGRQAMRLFLNKSLLDKFYGLNGPSVSTGRILSSWQGYSRSGRRGRDWTISFEQNTDFVRVAYELPDCGNGSYGLVASTSHWLHLEDD